MPDCTLPSTSRTARLLPGIGLDFCQVQAIARGLRNCRRPAAGSGGRGFLYRRKALSLAGQPESSSVPIRPERRYFYPIDWPIISRQIRFVRARGRCETCGRPHGRLICQLADGRWFDEGSGQWLDDAGRPVPWPDIVDLSLQRQRRIWLGTAHLDHDPGNSSGSNLKALCQRCHLRYDRDANIRRRRARARARRALGDLFTGPNPVL